MVNVIETFIRTEKIVDYHGNLSYIVTRMFHIFAAAALINKTKSMTVLSTHEGTKNLPDYKNTLKRFNAHRNYVVCYSLHELFYL